MRGSNNFTRHIISGDLRPTPRPTDSRHLLLFGFCPELSGQLPYLLRRLRVLVRVLESNLHAEVVLHLHHRLGRVLGFRKVNVPKLKRVPAPNDGARLNLSELFKQRTQLLGLIGANALWHIADVQRVLNAISRHQTRLVITALITPIESLAPTSTRKPIANHIAVPVSVRTAIT